jgi:hypothetical protein
MEIVPWREHGATVNLACKICKEKRSWSSKKFEERENWREYSSIAHLPLSVGASPY